MHHLSAQWIPPNERGQFLTSYLGSSVCIAVFYPLFGVIMSFWSWESVFYVSGVFGTIWYVAWLYFVYDSPDKHPRIDPKEKLYIQEALSDSIHVGKVNNKAILTMKSYTCYFGLQSHRNSAYKFHRVSMERFAEVTSKALRQIKVFHFIFAFFKIFFHSNYSKKSLGRQFYDRKPFG